MADDTLTLPGDIPGLLRRGSPVTVLTVALGPAVVFRVDRDGFSVQSDDADEMDGAWGGYTGSALALDLSDPTGRAHAAWWLVATLRKQRGLPDVGPGGMWQVDLSEQDHPCYWLHGPTDPGLSVNACPLDLDPDDELQASDPLVAPSLADLDPKDERRLLDGSRWVDAEALRRTVLHVAGREVPDAR